MKIFIAGASGATGRLLVKELLDRGHSVQVVVRAADRLPAAIRQHEQLSVREASLLDLADAELAELVQGCDAVASCLGHNLTFKGMYGHPRRLVTEATRRLCAAIKANGQEGKTKFVLMNTTGNRNRDLDERISLAEQGVVGLIRLLVPPHVDNEAAAEYLRSEIGQTDGQISWVVVRPDGLIDEDAVSAYELHPSPTRSAIFNAGQTSRINVGHFMAALITEEDTWQMWQGKMPVIYNTLAAKK